MIRPELTVAAIVERNGRFLIVEEKVRGQIQLNQPAGHVESGETFVDAVIRETREESAWLFLPEALVGVYLWPAQANRAPILRVVFCGDCRDHDPRLPLDDGILATHWLDHMQLIEANSRLRSPLVLRAIEDYHAGQRHPLEFVKVIDANSITAC